jgi:hypothetical protein
MKNSGLKMCKENMEMKYGWVGDGEWLDSQSSYFLRRPQTFENIFHFLHCVKEKRI